MNQEEMREYFGELCKDNKEINLNSIDDFWDSFETNINLNRFINACKRHTSKQFYNKYTVTFWGNFLKLCLCNRTIMYFDIKVHIKNRIKKIYNSPNKIIN